MVKRTSSIITSLLVILLGASTAVAQTTTIRGANKGTSTAQPVTSTPIDADHTGLDVNLVGGSISGADGALLDGVTSSIKATVFDFTNSNPLGVVLRDTNGDYVSVGGGTQYNQGTASTDTDTLTMMGCVRADTAAVATGVIDGDRARCIVDSTGRLWTFAAQSGTWTVTQSGTWNIGTVTTLTGITNPVTVTDGAGALNVICDSGCGSGTQYNQGTATTSTDALSMAGAVRHDTATVDAGVADGDRVVLSTDSAGRLRTTAVDTTQPVSGTVTVTDGAGALNVIVDSSALPTGAATSALQDGIIKDGSGDTTQANVSSGRVHVDGSGVTQPVSGTVTVTDGAGALNTIVDSGTLTAVTTITNPVTVTDGAGSLNVICDSGCSGGTQYDQGTATTDTDSLTMAGAVRRDTAAVATGVADGDRLVLSTDSVGRLRVTAADTTQPVSGTVTVTDGSGALNTIVDSGTLTAVTSITNPVTVTDGSGALNVICDSGCAGSGGTSEADDADFVAGTTAGTPAMGVYESTPTSVTDGDLGIVGITSDRRLKTSAAVEGTVTVSDGSGAMNTIVDSGTLTAVTTITNAVTVTDGSGALNVIVDSSALPTGAATSALQDGIVKDGAGDTTQANVSSGRLHVDGSGVTQPVSGTVTVTATNLDVQIGGSDSLTIGTFPDNEPFNVAQMNGVAVTMGNGASGTGVQRVTIANDSTGNIATIGTSVTPGTAAGNLGKAEDAAVSSGDTGVAHLLQREDTPTSTASATNEYIMAKANRYGHQFITSICNDPTLTTSVAIAQTALNGNAELVALTASQTIYVCGFDFISSGTANIRFVYGTDTACATGETGLTGAYPLIANTGIVRSNGGAIQMKTAVSNALCIETSASVNVAGMVTYAKGAF